MPERGLLVVLEGSDGSGKATQFNLLAERLKAAGYDVETFDFPRYGKNSSYFVKQYLNGKYGLADEISPYTASLFYALDRYEAAKDIKTALKDGRIVLINRYVGSNMAHQGAKFQDPVEQRGFFVWEDNLEYQLLGIPRPDINFFLRVPADISKKLIEERASKSGSDLDAHEANQQFLKKSLATYDLLCQLFPKDFLAIECTKDGKLMSVPDINNLLWAKLKPRLPAERPHTGHSTVITLSSAHPKSPNLSDSNNKLIHNFKDVSLFLKLNIARHIRTVEPPGFGLWLDDDYQFYTPSGLPKDIEKTYKNTIRRLAELHEQMRTRLQSYYERRLLSGADTTLADISALLRPATPLAALCSFKAALSPKMLRLIASQLLASDSEELQWSAKQLYLAGRQQWPEALGKPLESDGNPEPINNIIAKLADDKLSLNSGDKDEIKLTETSPRQEFSLLAESIFPYSSLSLDEINEEVSAWSYRQKYESLKQTAADPNLLEKVRYKFDLITDQLVMAELTSRAGLNGVQAQLPSPRFGYDVPPALEDAGIDDLYLECFDESLKLFSALQRAERDDLTVYSTLLGHKLRWQFSAEAGQLKPLFAELDLGADSQTRKLIYEAVSEVHPLIWEVLCGSGGAMAGAPPRKNRVKPSKQRKPKHRRTKDK